MVTSADVMARWTEIQNDDERILFVVGGPGSGKSRIIRELSENEGWKYIEAKELIDEALIEIRPEDRPQQASDCIYKCLKACQSQVVLIDSIDVLFAPILNIDPIALLRDLSKTYPIVVGWRGRFDGTQLHLEHNNNPEYFKFEVNNKNHVISID